MHMLDIYIVVLPALHVAGVRPNPLDFFSLVAIGCTSGRRISQAPRRLIALPGARSALGQVHRSEKLMKAASQPKPLWLVLAGGIRPAPALCDCCQTAYRAWLRRPMRMPRARPNVRRPTRSFEAENAQKLQEYAWVDKAKGTVQIPIERAMELTIAELNSKKPTPAGPIATPAPSRASPKPSPSPAAASIRQPKPRRTAMRSHQGR